MDNGREGSVPQCPPRTYMGASLALMQKAGIWFCEGKNLKFYRRARLGLSNLKDNHYLGQKIILILSERLTVSQPKDYLFLGQKNTFISAKRTILFYEKDSLNLVRKK